MQQIKDWLNSSRPYDAGVALYMRYGDDKQMKELFTEHRTPFKEKKLVELLKSLLNKSAAVKQKEEVKTENLKVNSSATHGWPAKMSKELAALKAVWLPLFKQRENLCARLYDVALLGKTDKNKEMEAGQMAHRILALQDEINGIYQDREYYIKHNCFPGKEQLFKPVVSDVKIAERRLTVRRYLTRLKNELSKPGSEKVKLKQEKKWTEYVAEMNYINEKLKRPYGEGIPKRKQ